ncbi:MAG: hypothetical protein KKH44_00410, partial [Bacteroidetes bacterium]|nr:hypothetical protein [Bacteroidota bacterium]
AEIIVYLKAKAKKQLDPAVYGQIRAYLHNKENPLAKVAKAFPAPEYELIEKQIEKANEKEIKNVLRVILLKTNVLEREGSQVVGQFFKEKDKEDKVKEGEYDQTSRD